MNEFDGMKMLTKENKTLVELNKLKAQCFESANNFRLVILQGNHQGQCLRKTKTKE